MSVVATAILHRGPERDSTKSKWKADSLFLLGTSLMDVSDRIRLRNKMPPQGDTHATEARRYFPACAVVQYSATGKTNVR
jgi:hypothetical protein